MRMTTRYHHSSQMRILLIALILLLISISFCGCGKSAATAATTESTSLASSQQTSLTETTRITESSAAPTAAPTGPTAAAALNPLTGLALPAVDSAGLRPVAIIINNHRLAVPQIGMGAADLIYEMPVEAGITRFLAVFTDASAVPEIGPVRSARHDFIDLAGGLDAILVHIGFSNLAEDQFNQQKTNHIDLGTNSKAMWRDAVWLEERGTEHSVKTTGERLAAAIAAKKYRTAVREGQAPAFTFRSIDEQVPAAGQDALAITIPYSSYTVATFTYDSKSKLYSKGEYGKPQIDLATGKPLQFTNVFIIQTKVEICDSRGHRDIDLAQGKGYYISGGKCQAVTWQKGSTQESFVFKDSNGDILQVNCGKSYIGIAPLQSEIGIES